MTVRSDQAFKQILNALNELVAAAEIAGDDVPQRTWITSPSLAEFSAVLTLALMQWLLTSTFAPSPENQERGWG
jgi:hypothetical protein